MSRCSWFDKLTTSGTGIPRDNGSRKDRKMTRTVLFAGIIALCLTAPGQAQPDKAQGITYRSPSGTTLRLMLDESNVGPEVTLGEIVFPPNSDSGDHKHGATEMFYIVSGELEHIVNGKSQVLKPGMSGYVKVPDSVRHKTGPTGAKAVVVWVPGDEGKKIAARWKREP
jgi:quercetin dioxygenase-like cupin family protein